MKIVAVEAAGNNAVVVPNCLVPESSWERMVGLLGHKKLSQGEGMWIEPCSSIHTLFMRFPIDAVFLAKNGQVLSVKKQLKPWRITGFSWRARSVLELPSGDAERLNIHEGACLQKREIFK